MDILGVRIDLLNLEQSMAKISEAITAGRRLWIVSANPELIYKAEKDKKLRDIVNSADLILPDGVGVVWAVRQLGGPKISRVTGVDLTLEILREADKYSRRIFLLGAAPGIAEKAVCRQQKMFPRVIFASHHGYFTQEEEAQVKEKIEQFRPDVLLVGLGAPKQELWNAAYTGRAAVRIGVGGTIDILSGEVKRAPQFFRNHKIEWLYRLIREPSRLRRQIILPLYVLRVLKKRWLRK